MADIENNNKLISIDGLTIYHHQLAKLLSNTYLTKTDASNTYLTPKQGDNRYIPSSWANRFVQYDIDASQQQLNSITLKNDTLTAKKLISLSTPVEDNDMVNKLYVDGLVSNKLDKVSNTATSYIDDKLSTKLDKSTSKKMAYVNDADGNPAMIEYSLLPGNSNIAQFDTNGHLYTESPTIDTHAANKKYVDSKINSAITTAINADY